MMLVLVVTYYRICKILQVLLGPSLLVGGFYSFRHFYLYVINLIHFLFVVHSLPFILLCLISLWGRANIDSPCRWFCSVEKCVCAALRTRLNELIHPSALFLVFYLCLSILLTATGLWKEAFGWSFVPWAYTGPNCGQIKTSLSTVGLNRIFHQMSPFIEAFFFCFLFLFFYSWTTITKCFLFLWESCC